MRRIKCISWLSLVHFLCEIQFSHADGALFGAVKVTSMMTILTQSSTVELSYTMDAVRHSSNDSMSSHFMPLARQDTLNEANFNIRSTKYRREDNGTCNMRIRTDTIRPIKMKQSHQDDEDAVTITRYIGIIQRPSVIDISPEDETTTRTIQVYASKVTTRIAMSSPITHSQSRQTLPPQVKPTQIATVRVSTTRHRPTETRPTTNLAPTDHKSKISTSNKSGGNNRSSPHIVLTSTSNVVFVATLQSTTLLPPTPVIQVGTTITTTTRQQPQIKTTIIQTLTTVETRTRLPILTKSDIYQSHVDVVDNVSKEDEDEDENENEEKPNGSTRYVLNTTMITSTRTNTMGGNKSIMQSTGTDTIQVMTQVPPGIMLQAVTNATRVGRTKNEGVRRKDEETKMSGTVVALWLLILLFVHL